MEKARLNTTFQFLTARQHPAAGLLRMLRQKPASHLQAYGKAARRNVLLELARLSVTWPPTATISA